MRAIPRRLWMSLALVAGATLVTISSCGKGSKPTAPTPPPLTLFGSPFVVATDPSASASGVSVSQGVTAAFSEAMDASTFSPSSFYLDHGVTGTIVRIDSVAVFQPSGPLGYNTTYRATITTAVKDIGGVPMAQPYSWTFKTATSPPAICSGFPPPPGEQWTYRVLGNGYVFSIIVESVTELIGGRQVYRLRRSDYPPGLGNYIACDPSVGEIFVASDWWDVSNPANHGRDVYGEPEPIDLCPYGTAVGHVCEWYPSSAGYDNRISIQVLAYETVTVPYGTFNAVEKTLVTYYVNGQVDDNLPPTYVWEDHNLGLIKELEVTPTSEIGIELIGHRAAGNGPAAQATAWRPNGAFVRMALHQNRGKVFRRESR